MSINRTTYKNSSLKLLTSSAFYSFIYSSVYLHVYLFVCLLCCLSITHLAERNTVSVPSLQRVFGMNYLCLTSLKTNRKYDISVYCNTNVSESEKQIYKTRTKKFSYVGHELIKKVIGEAFSDNCTKLLLYSKL